MASDASFISGKIHEVLRAAAKAFGPISPPIDPFVLAELCGVRKITRQLMIPEGVLKVVDDGFEVFLQDNFTDQPGAATRQRFTLAHELVHTFYYDRSTRPPRPLQGTPEGGKLELLCNSGAGQLLVPTFLLRKQAKERIISHASEIVELAQNFNVSPEVIVRRLDDVPAILESNFAVALIDFSDASKPTIQADCNTDWLRAEFQLPRPGSDFFQWIRPVWDTSKGEVRPIGLTARASA
jgi:Zn-dependent peptidase ImmA (M78 family)